MERLATTVDNFYERLGPRHWIFHDSLTVSTVEEILNRTADAASAEAYLIEAYRDKDASMYWIRRLRNVAGLRERFNQIMRDREHYDADQFDSCTLHLLAIMDGFVNDVEPYTRKALSSRDANEMVAWDHVVGHHLGLTNALRSFTKTIKRRVDETGVRATPPRNCPRLTDQLRQCRRRDEGLEHVVWCEKSGRG